MQTERKAFRALLVAAVWGASLTFSLLRVQAQESALPPEILAYADTVVYNGNVLTADDDFTIAEAAAIRDGRFIAVGSGERILRMAGPATKRINLEGKTVVPGFIDSHFHTYRYAFDPYMGGDHLWPVIELQELSEKTKEALLEVLERKAKEVPRREGWFIVTNSWGESKSPLTYSLMPQLRVEDLDRIFPDEPATVSSSHGDLYTYYIVNSRGLELFFEKYPQAENHPGLVRDSDGKPTGMIRGSLARKFGTEFLPFPDIEKAIRLLREANLRYNQQGITTIVSKTHGWTMTAIRELWARKELTTRWYAGIDIPFEGRDPEPALKRLGNLSDIGDSMFKIMGGQGSVPREFFDATWEPPRNLSGATQVPGREPEENPAEPDRGAYAFAKYGWNITGTHSLGDRSNDALLDAIEEGLKDQVLKARGQHFAIEHGLMVTRQTPAGNQFERMKQLGVIPSVNIGILLEPPRIERGLPLSHMAKYEMLDYMFGTERVGQMVPARSLIDAGIKPVAESDRGKYPLSSPLWILQHLITRKDDKYGNVYGASERISRKEALWMKTNWQSQFVGEEDLGTIEAGKLADLVVLGKDYLTVPEDEIWNIPVVLTMVGGKVVYDRERDGAPEFYWYLDYEKPAE